MRAAPAARRRRRARGSRGAAARADSSTKEELENAPPVDMTQLVVDLGKIVVEKALCLNCWCCRRHRQRILHRTELHMEGFMRRRVQASLRLVSLRPPRSRRGVLPEPSPKTVSTSATSSGARLSYVASSVSGPTLVADGSVKGKLRRAKSRLVDMDAESVPRHSARRSLEAASPSDGAGAAPMFAAARALRLGGSRRSDVGESQVSVMDDGASDGSFRTAVSS